MRALLFAGLLLALGRVSAEIPEMTLVLESIRPLGNGHEGNLFVTFRMSQTGPVFTAAADYNGVSRNEVTARKWELVGNHLDAELELRIGPDAPRSGNPSFPGEEEVFVVSLSAELNPLEWAPIRTDREFFLPATCKDTPPVAGKALSGSYQARRGDTMVSGKLTGAWRPPPRNGWSAVGPAWVEASPHSVSLVAFLPETERHDGIEAWAEFIMDGPVLPQGMTILSLKASAPVSTRVFLQVKTEQGWFSARQAERVGPAPREFRWPLDSLGDRWTPFAGEKVERVRVGVVDGSGVGRVEVEIAGLSLLYNGAAEEAPPSIPRVRVVLRPESAYALNGVSEVPPGLLGFQGPDLSPPATSKEGGPDALEPVRAPRTGLLRFLTLTAFGNGELPEKPRDSGDTLEDNTRKAASTFPGPCIDPADARDRGVWTHTADPWARPAWMDEGLESFLPKVEAYYASLAATAWSPEHPERVLRDLEVWDQPHLWARHINRGFLLPQGVKDWQDPTQVGPFPGRLATEAWIQLFRSAARGARNINPHLRLGGPSAPDFATNDYLDFRGHTLRVLQALGGELDFLTVHHHRRGNPFISAAAYDVARAASMLHAGRVIPIVNMVAEDPAESPTCGSLWNVSEILHLLRTHPDLVRGQARRGSCPPAAEEGVQDAGEEVLLAPLRGTLLDIDVDTPRLTVAASHPAPGEIVVVGADHGVGSSRIAFPMPVGFRVTELVLFPHAFSEAPPARPRLIRLDPTLRNGELQFPLPPRAAFRIRLHRQGYAPSRVRNQSFLPRPALFHFLAPGESLDLSVDRPFEPDRLFLRAVYTGSLEVVVEDGPAIALPEGPSLARDAELVVTELPPENLLKSPRLRATGLGALVLSHGWVMEE